MFMQRLTSAVVLSFCLSLIFCSVVLAQEGEDIPSPQEAAGVSENAETITPPAAHALSTPEPQVTKEEEPQEKAAEWVWGEVVSVDPQNKQVVIKHLDYESYEEVQMTLKVDEKTQFENIADLSEVKAGDHISVDYQVKDGSHIAEFIVVEKEETPGAPAAESSKEQKPTSVQEEVSPKEETVP